MKLITLILNVLSVFLIYVELRLYNNQPTKKQLRVFTLLSVIYQDIFTACLIKRVKKISVTRSQRDFSKTFLVSEIKIEFLSKTFVKHIFSFFFGIIVFILENMKVFRKISLRSYVTFIF